MRRWVVVLSSVGVGGMSLGLWLWLTARPTARVLAEGGAVAYVHGPPRLPWPLAVAVGVGAIAVTTFLVGVAVARRHRITLAEGMYPVAFATAPLCLLLVDLGRLAVPAGRLTNPLAALAYDLREVWAVGVGVTVVGLYVRHVAPLPRLWSLGPRRLAVVTFVVTSLVYLAFLPRAVLVGPTGDEPDYLLLAHSLVVDRDFDLANNVADGDYRRFVPRLQPHVREGPHGGLYTAHRLGLPILIAPAYGVGLLAGWPVRIPVVVGLSLLAALVVARTMSWAAALTGSPGSALAAGLAVAWSAPGFFYAYAIYPELPVALVVLEVLRLTGERGGNPWVVGLLLATLPWFHEKFIPLTLALAGGTCWVLRPEGRVVRGLGVPLAMSGLLQVLYYLRLYGAPVPVGVHAGFAPLAGLHAGLVGLWLDRDHGLLALAPIYLFAALGLPAFAREQRRTAILGLVAFVSLYAVVGTYREWWGGFAPAPRYLVPVLPILLVALAFGIRAAVARGHALRVLLVGGASSLIATYAVIYPALQYRHAHPLRSLFPGIDWTRYWPAWLAPDERTWPLTALALLIATLLLLGRRAASPAGGWRLTGAGLVSLLTFAGVVFVGDRVSGAAGPYLTAEEATRSLRAFLFRTTAHGRPGNQVAVAMRPPSLPGALRLTYEAERLPGQAGETVEDPLAENGLARAGGRVGTDLVFGPYETLPPGPYEVRFRLRGEPGAGPGRVATLGITAERGKMALATREVRAEELVTEGYREVPLPIRLDARARDLEWRVRLEQPRALRIDRVTVIPLGLVVGGDGVR